VRQFLERDLIPEVSRARFDAAVAAAMRLRNSAVAEALLPVLVYINAIFVWPHYGVLDGPAWCAVSSCGGRQFSASVGGVVCVSLPLFQFILLRWYFRIVIWIRFLWQVARCTLSLVPTHPDRVGGLGFLSGTAVAFAPVLAAHGTLLAGLIAGRIFFDGATLPDFNVEI